MPGIRYPIRFKLFFCLVLIFLAALFSGAQGVRGMRAIFNDLEGVRTDQLAQSAYISEAHIALLAWNREIHKHVLADSRARMEQLESDINSHARTAFEKLDTLQKLPRLMPEVRNALDDVHTQMDSMQSLRARVLSLSKRGAKKEARDLTKNELRARMDRLDSKLKKFMQLLRIQVDLTLTEAEMRYRQAVVRIVIIVGAALIISLALALWVSRGILVSVRSMSNVARGVDAYLSGDANAGAPFPRDRVLIHSRDEFAYLGAVFNEMLASLQSNISRRVAVEGEQTKLIGELQEALTNVKLLSGLLPICSSCKKVRDDAGYWRQIEEYISRHSQAEFTHSVCPECMKRLYPGVRS